MLKNYTREEKSWMLYDWANSAFSAIVAAIILPVFFKTVASAGGVSDVNATAYWGYATSLGTFLCAMLAPFLGTLGDYRGMRKKLFTAFMLLGVVSTFLLAMTDSWKMLLLFYVLGSAFGTFAYMLCRTVYFTFFYVFIELVRHKYLYHPHYHYRQQGKASKTDYELKAHCHSVFALRSIFLRPQIYSPLPSR